MRIYLTNLGKYNEGELVGRWLSLPCSDIELESALQAISVSSDGEYQEYFITSYETSTGLAIGEYDRLDDLNEIAGRIDGLDTHELMTLQAIIEHEAPDVSAVGEILDRLDEYQLYEGIGSDEALGSYWLYESGCYDLSVMGTLSEYIDCESFGRDMRLNSSGNYTANGWLECS